MAGAVGGTACQFVAANTSTATSEGSVTDIGLVSASTVLMPKGFAEN
jgi:hypothetical protein